MVFTKKNCLAVAAYITAFSAEAWADGKAQYHLLNPTPRDQMRAFSVEPSPYTVDAGRIILELSMIDYTRKKSPMPEGGQSINETTRYGTLNARIGLTNNWEGQVGLSTHNSRRLRLGTETEAASGFGDTTLKLKGNIVGNDGGPVAVALAPTLKIPTARAGMGNRKLEAGVSAPIGASLHGDLSLTVTPQVFRRIGEAGETITEFGAVTNLEYGFSDSLSVYGEFSNDHSSAPGSSWSGLAGGGVNYLVTPSILIDVGVNFGVSEAAPDYNPFLGVSFRF